MLLFGHSGHVVNSDEGIVLHGAWNLWNGREPYTDFFEYMTPGSFYLVYWLWEVFGPHYMAAKALAVIALFTACIGIHLTGRLLSLNVFSYAGPLLYALASFDWPLVNHNTFNIVLIIWANYFFVRSLDNGSILGLMLSGLTAGFSFLLLQHKSAILIAVTCVFLLILWRSEKRLIWLKGFIVYLLCVSVPLLTLLKWPLDSLFDNLVYFPMVNYIPISKVSLWPFVLALLVLMGSMLLIRGASNRLAQYLVVAQAALLLTALQRTDYMHVSITLAPLLALLPYLWERTDFFSMWKRYFQLIPVAAFLIGFPIGIATAKLPNMYFLGEGRATRMIEYVRLNCARNPYLYAGPFMPGLYFETGKMNATSFSILLTGFNTSDQFNKAKRELEENKPTCIVTNYEITKKYNYDLNNPVEEFIRLNYRLERSFGETGVYTRE